MRLLLGVMALGAVVTACGMPAVTRTAIVKDVRISDELSPQNVVLHPGDEIRWINVRKDEIQLDVPHIADRDLTCARGFSNWLGQVRESIQLEPNQTASVCFSTPTVMQYVVRTNSALPGGKQLLTGSLSIVDNR